MQGVCWLPPWADSDRISSTRAQFTLVRLCSPKAAIKTSRSGQIESSFRAAQGGQYRQAVPRAPFFRFVDGESGYEANQIVVAEGNVIIGGSSSFSWVNIDGGVFHHNVVSRPGQWVARILNENGGLPIVDTQNGIFQDNRIVYNDTASEFSTAINVGPETLPNMFTFARNQWLNLADPTVASSTPSLPAPETGGTYVGLPATTDGPYVWSFVWGRWIVNASHAANSRRYRSAVYAPSYCRAKRVVRPARRRPAWRGLDVDSHPNFDASHAGVFTSNIDRSGRGHRPPWRLRQRHRWQRFSGLATYARQPGRLAAERSDRRRDLGGSAGCLERKFRGHVVAASSGSPGAAYICLCVDGVSVRPARPPRGR